MQNVIIGYPNRINGSTITGGSYVVGLPVTNLATRELAQVARTTDATTASTKIRVDLTQLRTIKVLGLINHNITQSGTWRVRGSNVGFDLSDVFDSTAKSVWQMSFGDFVEWESATWWSGIAGDEYLRSPYNAQIVLDDWYSVRYLTIDIVDTTNPDGYVQIGRLFAGNAIQPAVNADFGLQDAWEDMSSFELSEDGAMFATARRRLRLVTFQFSFLSHTEAQYIHELQRLSGTIDEILYIPYPDDMGESQRYGFMGAMQQLSAIEYPRHALRSTSMRIKELG